MQFIHHAGNPIIPRTPGTFHSIHSANVDVLLFGGKYHFYFRGQGDDRHDQIAVGVATPQAFDGVHWDFHPENPVLRVGQNASDFDSAHVLDPGTVEFRGKVFLYYTAHSLDRSCGPGIGLAIAEDGIHFRKALPAPVLQNCGAPEVVEREGLIHLFYTRRDENYGPRGTYCCTSHNGIHFDLKNEQFVFGPAPQEGAFDSFMVGTVRIFEEPPYYYMTYGGSHRFWDYPGAIGLARSLDLLRWERYPGNPVFERGKPGSWDEGALWFPTVIRHGDTYYMWYEGGGAGLGLETPEAQAASHLSREIEYGGYAKTTFSQIGLATHKGKMPDW